MEKRVIRVLEFGKIIEQLADHAASSLGRERASALVPIHKMEQIRRMQAETTEARDVLALFGSVPLAGFADVRPQVKKAVISAVLHAEELVQIASTLASTRRLHAFLVKHGEDYPILGKIAENMSSFQSLEDAIGRCIGPGGDVLDSASPAIARVRSEMKTTHGRMMDKLNSIIQSSKYKTALQEPVITQREDRYCVPVKVEYKSQIKGIVHDASASGATLFVEPEQVVEFGNDLKRLAIREREEIQVVLGELTAEVSSHSTDILNTLDLVAHVDFVFAKAKLSLAHNANEPALNQDGRIRLVQARHPLLTGDVVPIDVELGNKFNALLITGPNTGGKTVTLKTIGLLTLMMQAGLHVPSGIGTEMAVFDQVFADIGDEQSIEQSLSTFSSHIKNIVHVARTIRPNALVLFDEIGAGTDPGEGAAMAKSIVEYMLKRGARVVATTHYGELKEYAFTREGVQNASVEFDIETLRPTYRLMIGVPGSSNAFAIAARLGMPREITVAAKQAVGKNESGSVEMIRRIEESHREAMEERDAAKHAADEADILRRRYEEKLAKVEAARARAEDEVREQGRKLVVEYEKRLDEALAKLAEAPKRGKEAEVTKHAARQSLRDARRELLHVSAPEVEERDDSDAPLKKGDHVKISTLGQSGVLAEDIVDNQASVIVGSVRLTVPVDALRRAKGPVEKSKRESTGISITLSRANDVSTEIMLREQRVEAALFSLDQYLDDAQAAGLEKVRVIHGKGTGAMRNAVWQFLRNHPSVESYKLAEQSEGGSGVTVVTLKV